MADSAHGASAITFETAGLTVGPRGAATELPAAGSGFNTTLVFIIKLSTDGAYRRVDLHEDAATRFTLFESVRLVGARATVMLGPGDNQMLWIAVRDKDVNTANLSEAAYVTPIPGQTGAAVGTWVFPMDAPFSHELKALSPGNPPPAITFGVSDPANPVTVRLAVDYHCSGIGLPSPIVLKGAKGTVS